MADSIRSGAPVGSSPAPELLMRRLRALPPRRRLAGLAVAVLGLPTLTVVLLSLGPKVDLSTALLCYLALTMAVAAVGGMWPSPPTAVAGFAAGNWYFTPPFETWTVDRGQDVLALAVFLAAAITVSVLVDLVACRAVDAERARAEGAALTRLAVNVADSPHPLDRLVEDLVSTFQLRSAAVLSRNGRGWRVDAHAGVVPLPHPDDGTDTIGLSPDTVLSLHGTRTPHDGGRLLAAFVAQLALAVRRQTLEAEAARAEALAETDRLRTALLTAVSHDLRTPLATIKAWLTGLVEGDVAFRPVEVEEILTSAVGEVDRLNNLVGNLLDMSRLHIGAIRSSGTPVAVDAATSSALSTLPPAARRIRLAVPENLPHVRGDPVLLERILANLLDNALRHTPDSTAVEVAAEHCEDSGHVRLQVIDHGPGIKPEDRARIFEPFQRLGDQPNGGGIGLGLAVAKGLAASIDGALVALDTPGGGTTMLLTLRACA